MLITADYTAKKNKITELEKLTWNWLWGRMPDSDSSKLSSFDKQLVVMKHARLSIPFLCQQLPIVGGPVKHVGRLVVRDTWHKCQVAATRVVTNNECIRAIESGGHHNAAAVTSSTRTAAAVAWRRIEQAVVGVVKDEGGDVDAADDQTTSRRLIDAAIHLKLCAVNAAVDAPEHKPNRHATHIIVKHSNRFNDTCSSQPITYLRVFTTQWAVHVSGCFVYDLELTAWQSRLSRLISTSHQDIPASAFLLSLVLNWIVVVYII